MKETDKQNGSVELWGATFSRKEFGLDEDEVVSFVDKLISERDKLSERQGHLTYLAELAEKTVAEADNIATRIKEEAKTTAETEAEEIRAEAKRQAQKTTEEHITEAKAAADKEIEATKLKANKHSAELIKKNMEKLQADLNNRVNEMCQELLAETESYLKETVSYEADPIDEPAATNQEKDEPKMVEEDEDSQPADTPESSDNVAEAEVAEPAEAEEESGEDEAEKPVSRKDWYTSEEEEVMVLEFLPPRDQEEIESIQKQLDSLPEVSATEMKIMVDKTVIEVLLGQPLNLFETMEAMPIVQQITEVEEDGQNKLQIVLDLVSSIDMSRDVLNRDFSNLLSKKK